MKKKIIILLSLLLIIWPSTSRAAERDLAKELSGRILLQVQSYGRAWYVEPVSQQRYYLRDGDEAYNLMRTLGLGISNADLAKIPTTVGQKSDNQLVNRLKGRILLQVQDRGQAWYVNPVDGLRYYLADGQAAYNLMRSMGLGITTDDLATITINTQQIVPDTAFNQVAYTSYDGQNFSGQNDEVILPLASLTKLMTALVFLDTNPKWDDSLVIDEEVINYPKEYVGDDSTSEVAIKLGDKVKVSDLWSALLVASSNQSAAGLLKASGLSLQDFVSKMNDKAKVLGLGKTHFVDVAGLDAHNVSTAREMAILAREAFSQTMIAAASRQRQATMTVMSSDGQWRSVPVTNRNYSLLEFNPDGAKTGFLVEAQRNVALQKNGLTIVVLHARSMTERNNLIKNFLQ